MFISGDFNQRLTIWGSRSIDDLEWAVPDVKVAPISVTGRVASSLPLLAHWRSCREQLYRAIARGLQGQ
jgi:hypothetical protein